MQSNCSLRRASVAIGAVIALGAIAVANAQNAPSAGGGAGPSPSKIAVENRKAAYTLIGNNFRWFGAVLKGTAPYDEAEAVKRAQRIAFLSALPGENFPEGSNPGEPDSKAKPDVWSNRAEFDKKLHEFQEHAAAFAETVSKEKGATEPFKAAVTALGQDCKGCHETFKAK